MNVGEVAALAGVTVRAAPLRPDRAVTATYEAMAAGLALYVSTANQANAARQG